MLTIKRLIFTHRRCASLALIISRVTPHSSADALDKVLRPDESYPLRKSRRPATASPATIALELQPAMTVLLRRREAVSLVDVHLTRIFDCTTSRPHFDVLTGRAVVLPRLVEATTHATPSFLRCIIYDQGVDYQRPKTCIPGHLRELWCDRAPSLLLRQIRFNTLQSILPTAK